MSISLKKNKISGFSLIEVLLSISIIVMITGFSLPIYQSLQVKNDLEIATESLAQSLRRVQNSARAVIGDSQSGVYVETGNIIIFRGSSYASRDEVFDEVIKVSPTIVFSGESEYVFQKLTGGVTLSGTTTLSSVNGDERDVYINEKGTVTY